MVRQLRVARDLEGHVAQRELRPVRGVDLAGGLRGHPLQESFQEAFDTEENWAFPPADPPSGAEVSDPPVYGRGAMVLYKIRQKVGKETFQEILTGWPATHPYGNASTADFTEYVEEESGQDLSEVWNTWLYGTEKPARP